MLPLLIKDHLLTASAALVIIFYLVADLCLLEAASSSSANVRSSSLGTQTSMSELHINKTVSLMVCNAFAFTSRLVYKNTVVYLWY